MEKYSEGNFYCEKCQKQYPITSIEYHDSICNFNKKCPFCLREINIHNFYEHIMYHEFENEEIPDELNYNNNNKGSNENPYPSYYHFLNNNNEEKYEPEIKRINSKIVKVGNDEFYDLEEEANKIKYEEQEKEAYEKKILGLKKKQLSFPQKIKKFFKENKEEIYGVTINSIGCAFLIPECFLSLTLIIILSFMSQKKKENDEDKIDPKKIIDYLPTTTLGKRYNNNSIELKCIICYEDFQEGDNVTTLPCAHVFHIDCIKVWILQHGNCPVCKFIITKRSLLGDL